jgi:ubiquinone/menaquinone biosynthesis C-methylase UbiE
MKFYSKLILPKIVHYTCGLKPNMRQREKVVPQARGCVLEIDIGSGLNLPFYDSTKVTKIWGLDPSPEMIKLAEQMARSLHLEVEFIGLPADEMQLDDRSIDTVLITYTLCSILDTTPALRQMARVLRPGGELIFCEHGAAPDANVRRWQNRLNPIWKQFAGGCNLNRPIPDLVESGGFRINALEMMYISGWRPACFNYWGIAVPR